MVVIETERLILRPLSSEDHDDYLALANEPEVARFTIAITAEQATERLAATERQWAERGHGGVAILERTEGRFLGRSGLHHWPQFAETEIGWSLRRSEWGNGYATEAAEALVEWGFRTFPLPYLTAMIRHDNDRSLAVARRLGFEPLREDFLIDIPLTVHALSREAHEPR